MTHQDRLLELAIDAAKAYASSLSDTADMVRAMDTCLKLKALRRPEVVKEMEDRLLAAIVGPVRA